MSVKTEPCGDDVVVTRQMSLTDFMAGVDRSGQDLGAFLARAEIVEQLRPYTDQLSSLVHDLACAPEGSHAAIRDGIAEVAQDLLVDVLAPLSTGGGR